MHVVCHVLWICFRVHCFLPSTLHMVCVWGGQEHRRGKAPRNTGELPAIRHGFLIGSPACLPNVALRPKAHPSVTTVLMSNLVIISFISFVSQYEQLFGSSIKTIGSNPCALTTSMILTLSGNCEKHILSFYQFLLSSVGHWHSSIFPGRPARARQ